MITVCALFHCCVLLWFSFWSMLPIFFRVISQALGQSYDCPSVSEITLNNMDKIDHTNPAWRKFTVPGYSTYLSCRRQLYLCFMWDLNGFCYIIHDEVTTWKQFLHYWPFFKSRVDFPHKEPVMQRFDVSFVVRLNKLLNKQPSFLWFKTTY